MFRLTRLRLAKTCGQGRLLVSSLSNDKNAGFGLKVFGKKSSTQFIGPNFSSRYLSSYRCFSSSTEDEERMKFSRLSFQKIMDELKQMDSIEITIRKKEKIDHQKEDECEKASSSTKSS
uniref:Uncharacterized protein n=1 Tax=Meloidogyne incognita TaxID=6306 RepID=A0A914LD66_MELIC